ncbi:MAG TPA: PAS domain S-box protein, partial [Anaerolineaceae bacterium]|nr:PAS domain S-box protein [Anaerolineaceae bacterium]
KQVRRLMEYATEIIFDMAPDGSMRYASPSFREILGYEPLELVGTNVFDLLHPEDRPLAIQTIAQAALDRKPCKLELRCVHKDGRLLTVETTATPTYLEDGTPNGMVVFSRDVTQQKLAEAALQVSEENFRAIVDSIPIGMHMYAENDEGQLAMSGYNPAAVRILQVDHENLIGKNPEDAFPGLIGTGISERYHEVLKTGIPWSNDRFVYSQDQINSIFDLQAFRSSPNKLVVAFSDISPRVKTERALKQSNEKFSRAFAISPDTININRLSDGLYIDVNPAFCQHTGYDRDEVIGQTTRDIDIWGEPADRLRFINEITTTGSVQNLEAKFRYKDGTLITGLISARVLDINGEKCILSVVRNISDRIRTEEALREAHSRLEDAYEATLQGWVHALELREHETADHSRRVVELTRRMALEFGFSGESLALIQRGALLHDIGKIGVPDSILLKPGPLTPEEWTIMRYHPRFAYDLLAQIPYLQRSVDIPYCHHERWDGSGYPRGIAKEKIPLSARIFAVVDVFDALLSDRPYRPAWSLPDVIRYLIDQKGKQFDPLIVDCFLAMIEKEKAREDGTPTIEKQPQS